MIVGESFRGNATPFFALGPLMRKGRYRADYSGLESAGVFFVCLAGG